MRISVIVFSASMLYASLATADVKETEEFSYEINSGGRISLENINGDVKISGGNDGKVQVIAHKKAGSQEYMDGLKVVIDADSEYIRIETKHPKSSGDHWYNKGNNRSGSITYELKVPSAIDLDTISTVNGDLQISLVSGKVKAETANGSLDVRDLAADINLETVNGSIEAHFETLGGGQRVSADTVNGKIVLFIPADSSATVNAETLNGSIKADDFGLEADKGFIGHDLDGQIGAGEARISLDTVNGSIRLKKK